MGRAKRRKRSWKFLLLAALLGFLTLVAYWNSFDVPLVFDDLLTIQANSGVQFGASLRPTLWVTRPVLYVTFAINYALHGQQVWGYHLVNVTLHFLNSILVLLIGIHIFRRSGASENDSRIAGFLAAAFFLVHPVQTESVTFISSRSELLSTFFYALAFLAFIKRDEQKIGFLWSLIVAIPFVLGLFTKETVVSLPAALLLYDLLFLSGAHPKSIFKRWHFYATFAAGGVAAIYVLVTNVLRGAIGSAVSHATSWQYFLTELRVLVRYIRLLVVPIGLNLDYDFPKSNSIADLSVLVSSAAVFALLGLGWYLRRRQSVLSFSIFWFFITLAPTSSFVPIADVIFEHRLYLPLVGVSLAFPVLIFGIRHLKLIKQAPDPVIAISTALLFLLCLGTILRNQVWRDETTLWSDTIEKSPHKARPYNSLATIYFNRRQFDRALDIAQRGLQNVTDESSSRDFQQMTGQIFIQMRRYEEAAAMFRETSKVEDKHLASQAYNNIGVAYVNMAQNQSPSERERLLSSAAEAFRKSADLDPEMFFAFDSYVNTLCDIGKKEDLQRELETKLAQKDYRVFYGLGKIAFISGDYDSAVQHFSQAIGLNAQQKMIFFNQAYALNQLRRRDEAIQNYLQVLRLDPLFVQARHNLALLYLQSGDYSKAIDSFLDALRLDPNYVSAHLNLAKAYSQIGNSTGARDHLQKVLSMSPENQEAIALWRKLGS